MVLARPEGALDGDMKYRLGDLAHELRLGLGRRDHDRLRSARLQQAHRFILGFANLDKPMIAAVRGAAFGVGFSLALCSDLRVDSRTAKFGLVFKKVGLAPDGGIAWFLSHAINACRAKELMLSACLASAEEAQALGFAAEVVDDDRLDTRVMVLAEELAASATFALAMGKCMFLGAAKPSLEDFLEYESHVHSEVLQTEDHCEGRRSRLTREASSRVQGALNTERARAGHASLSSRPWCDLPSRACAGPPSGSCLLR